MLEIARDHSLTLPYNDINRFRSLVQVVQGEPLTYENFLGKFNSLRKFFINKEVIQRITRETIIEAAEENIRYMELRFTPVALTRLNDASLGTAMDWVIEATNDASTEYGIPVRLIVSPNRHESVELAEETIEEAIKRKDQGVVAVDLAGSEATHPGEEFAHVFKTAKEAGLHVTIHGGEWGGPENVVLAIEKLYAERVGHGVRVMEDPAAVELARDAGVIFEVCPTSNLQSGVYGSVNDHPLPKMIEEGLKVTINTDDPGIEQVNLSDEFELAAEALLISRKQLYETILCAARAAFLPDDEKEALIASLDGEINGN
jgi:adenosine deaminase